MDYSKYKCFICNEIYSDPLRKNEISKKNCYLDRFTRYSRFKAGSLSVLASGDPSALERYNEEQQRDHERIMINMNSASYVKKFQPCRCTGKVAHLDCLVKYCLLHVEYFCKDCNFTFAFQFREDKNLTKKTFLSVHLFQFLYILIFICLVVFCILLFLDIIKTYENPGFFYYNYIIGVLTAMIALLFAFLIIKLFIETKNLTNANSVSVFNYSATNNKVNLISVKKINANDSSIINDKSSDRNKLKQFTQNYILFTQNRLDLDTWEIAEMKVVNRNFLDLEINHCLKLSKEIQEGNIEFQIEEEENKEDDNLDIVLDDIERNQYIRKKNTLDKPINLLAENSSILCLKENELLNKRQFSMKEDYSIDYNKIAIKKQQKKQNDSAYQTNIFNLNLKALKPRKVVQSDNTISKQDKKEGGSLFGNYIKKKKAKEKEAKEKAEKEKNQNKFNYDLLPPLDDGQKKRPQTNTHQKIEFNSTDNKMNTLGTEENRNLLGIDPILEVPETKPKKRRLVEFNTVKQ